MKILPTSKKYKEGILLILFAGVILCIWQLGSTGLVDETPPLFAAASRAMSETGNWLTPRVNGLNRFDKPPFIYWLMGVFYLLPGHSIWDPLGTWSARLPSAISTVLMMIFIGDTLMRCPDKNDTFPRRTAVIAALAFALSPLVVIWSRIAVSDALLCSTLGISLLLNWRTYISQSNRYWWTAWVVLGLSVLTKGPVSLVLAGLTFIIFGFVQRDFYTIFKRNKPIKGLFITLLVSAPWYIAELLVEGRPFWDSFFGYHNFQRLTSVVNNHSQPWWFFGMMLLISSLPFTPFLLIGLKDFISSLFRFNSFQTKEIRRIDQSLVNFSGSWLLSVFILFSLAATKLPSYWLPAVPAASILIAISSNNSRRSFKSQAISYFLLAISMLALAFILFLPELWIFSIDDPEMPDLASNLLESKLYLRASILLFLVSCIGFYFAIYKRFRSIFILQIPLIFIQVFVMLPLWNLADELRHKPVRQVSQKLLSIQNKNEPIAMVGIRKPSLHFYTRKLVTYESHSPVGLVNLSNRLRYEERDNWNNIEKNLPKEAPTFLLVIDRKTSTLQHWQNLEKQELGNYGVYKIWRLKKQVVEEREKFLRSRGVMPNWRETTKERY